MTNFTITIGDTFQRTATMTAGGSAVNLTGATLWWTLKLASDTAPDDLAAIAKLFWVDGGSSAGIAVSDPLTGQAVVTLTPAVTDSLSLSIDYRWDLQLKDSIGRIFTVDQGRLLVGRQITVRTTTP